MILAGNQPYFLPYIGYWQLINAVDLFEICDDYNYRKGWVNRNRILVNGNPSYFHLDIQHPTVNKKINEHIIADFAIDLKLHQLQIVYGRAPFFRQSVEVMEEIYGFQDRNLGNFLANSIQIISNYLGIKTRFILSSEYERNRSLKSEESVIECCHILGGDTYYNAIGGTELYSFENFRENGIKLAFLKMGDIHYRQFNYDFVPNLSILDVMMFNPVEKIQEMLNEYTLVTD